MIDGAKALRAAIEEVFGTDQPVQRCRNHKMENVMEELPKDQQSQTRNLMRAALEGEERRRRGEASGGVVRMDQAHPSALLPAGYRIARQPLLTG